MATFTYPKALRLINTLMILSITLSVLGILSMKTDILSNKPDQPPSITISSPNAANQVRENLLTDSLSTASGNEEIR